MIKKASDIVRGDYVQNGNEFFHVLSIGYWKHDGSGYLPTNANYRGSDGVIELVYKGGAIHVHRDECYNVLSNVLSAHQLAKQLLAGPNLPIVTLYGEYLDPVPLKVEQRTMHVRGDDIYDHKPHYNDTVETAFLVVNQF